MYAALFDACVLHPWVLCQLELLLAERGLYRPVWSDQILEETRRSIVARRQDLDEAKVTNRIAAMRLTFDDAVVNVRLVEAEMAAVPPSVAEHDRHVVAAALAGRADVIVTSNLRHFPDADLAVLGLQVQSPDDFLIDQWYLNAELVADTIVWMALQTQRPALSPEAVLSALGRTVPMFVATVRASAEWRDASAGLEQPDEAGSAARQSGGSPVAN